MTIETKIRRYQQELISVLTRHSDRDGLIPTAIPSLSIYRASTVTKPSNSIYNPSLFVIAQGSKVVTLAHETYRYDNSSYLVTSVRLPVAGQIIEATPQKPYLSVVLSFEADEILDVLKGMEQAPQSRTSTKRGMLIHKMNVEMLNAVVRLTRLLDTPKDIPVLSPLITREILYRLLQDDRENFISQFAIVGSHAQNISKVIRIISQHYSSTLRIDELAKEANMSPSALHSQFKKVTAMSPIQYQQLIRLQEARRILLAEMLDAATVSSMVGYESPSQFSREYARMFGLPPIRDVKRIRASIEMNDIREDIL